MRVIIRGACVPCLAFHFQARSSLIGQTIRATTSADAVGCDAPGRRKGPFRARLNVIRFAAFRAGLRLSAHPLQTHYTSVVTQALWGQWQGVYT